MSTVMNQSAPRTTWIIAAPRTGMLPVLYALVCDPNMVEEWLRSEAKALELSFVSVVHAGRARLLTIGERRQNDRQLGVGPCPAMSRLTL
jgi:hypothetical protein